MTTVPFAPNPALTPLFAGRAFSEVLEERTNRALTHARSLEPKALRAPVAVIAQRLADTYDVALSVIDWDEPRVGVGTTPEQRMRAVTDWIVEEGVEALTWRPTQRWLTSPSARVGLVSGALVCVVDGPTLTASEINTANTAARRFVDAHRTFLWEEHAAWRTDVRRRIYSALIQRRSLLATLPDVAHLNPSKG